MKQQILNHRRAIGILGALLPFLCLIIGSIRNNDYSEWYKTMSATYYTNASDIFVGVLFATGIFLICYEGYDWRDKIVNRICGISALGIAIFPNGATDLLFVGTFQMCVKSSLILHCIFAGIFFATLAINILWLFTKSNSKQTKNKRIRNIIYNVCGYGIFFFLLMLGVYVIYPFWEHLGYFSETMMLLLFATAWLIKGETIYKDF